MIQVQQLTKYYGERAAIRALDFAIDRGEVIGFLGLNGAGKTTTLKVLGCVLLPTSGRVVIDGIDIARDPHEVRRRIGFLPDAPPLYDEMTVGGYLEFAAQLRGVTAKDARSHVVEAEEKTGLRQVDGERVSSLSHGFRQRAGVAQALVHKPRLLILDEPTSGLDPVQIVEMRSLIRSLRGDHTILLSSHILSEISQTCDRLLVIQAGEIVAQGSEQELASRLGSVGRIEVDVGGNVERALAVVRALEGVVEASAHARPAGGGETLHVEGAGELRPQITRALVQAGIDVLRIDRGATGLESIFLQLTKGDARTAGATAAAAGKEGASA